MTVRDPLPDVTLEELSAREIPLAQLVKGSQNPREDATWEVDDLAKSIKAVGVLQPIIVRPVEGGKFEIIAGGRRYEASKLAGRESIPAIATEASDADAAIWGLIENLQRQDLLPIDEAKAFKRLIEVHGISQRVLGNRVGRSQPYISNSMRMLEKLTEEVQAQVQAGQISVGHAKELMRLEGDAQIAVANQIIEEQTPVAELASAIRADQAEKNREARYDKAKEDEFDQAIETLKTAEVAPERVVVFHSKELAEAVRQAGYSASEWEDTYHQTPVYECDCDGLLYTQYAEGGDRLHKVCLVEQHYLDFVDAAEGEQRMKAEANKQLLTEQRRKLGRAISGDTGISSRLLLFFLLGDPMEADDDAAAFMKRRKRGPEEDNNGLWDLLASMEPKDVNREIVLLLTNKALYNVFASDARLENARTYHLRQWLVDHAKIDPALVWGGHEPYLEEQIDDAEPGADDGEGVSDREEGA